MAYLQWKQRLYAFLLRRILGPYLTQTSLQKLHESIDVSFQEGTFTLKDINLNTTFLSSMIREKSPALNIEIFSARIGKLQIHLALQERSKPEGFSTSSVAWKAMQLGGNNGVSLVAHIDIDEFELFIRPLTEAQMSSPSRTTYTAPEVSQESTTSGMISSYVDAAMKSLRLSLQMNDLRIRFCGIPTDFEQKWIQIGLTRTHYHDVDTGNTSQAPSVTSKVALHKAIEYSGIMFRTGETQFCGDEMTEQASVIARSEGVGQLTWRAIDFINLLEKDSDVRVRVQNEIEAKLNQRINISVEESSLHCILGVVCDLLSYRISSDTIGTSEQSTEQIPIKLLEEKNGIDTAFDDIKDLHTVEGIMRQYEQAKELAERNEIRGGMLLPNSENGSLTFDAFFDANDQGMASLSSVLEESMMMATTTDIVHTYFKLHLQEFAVKVSFQELGPTGVAIPPRRPSAYILFTFGDVNLSSWFSSKIISVTGSLSHALIETSQAVGHRLVISTILKFSDESHHHGQLNEDNVVSIAPCIDVSFEIDSNRSACRNTVGVRLQRVEVMLCPKTVSKSIAIVSRLQEKVLSFTLRNQQSTYKSENVVMPEIHLSIISPGISFYCPVSKLESDTDSEQEKLIAVLFRRCGYDVLQEPIADHVYFGLSLQNLTISNINQGLPLDASPLEIKGHLISCQHLLVFMIAPRIDSGGRICSMQRVDILASSGHAPISIYYKLSGPTASQSVCRAAFPIVKPMSSFKARQEDDDGPNLIPTMTGAQSEDFSSLRSPDPQPTILKEVDKCNNLLELRFPEMCLDLTKSELVSLSQIISDTIPPCTNSEDAMIDEGDSASKEKDCFVENLLGVSITFERITIHVHHTMDPLAGLDDSHWETYSFCVIGEEWNFFSILGSNLRCTRLSTMRFDLYEADGLLPARPEMVPPVINPCVLSCCNKILQRTKRNHYTRARPILYKTALFSILSPDSPVFLVDLIHSRDHERSIYISLYTISYRHDIESKWIERFLKLIKLGDECEHATEIDTVIDPGDRAVLLTRVFVTLADCNVDYTPPTRFVNPSRTIIRVSEVRISSNIVSPLGSVQAYQFTVGDLSLLICNRRYPYSSENMTLSGSSHLLSKEDLEVKLSGVNIEQDMNLITMVTLDSANALVTCTTRADKSHEPYMALSLRFGTLCLHGCKDSFACLLNTFSEWNIYVNGLSEESIVSMKTRERKNRSYTMKPLQSDFSSLRDDHGVGGGVKASDDGKMKSKEQVRDSQPQHGHENFDLDGYDWMTVDHGWSRQGIETHELQPGNEQSARWYGSDETREVQDCWHDCDDVLVHRKQEHVIQEKAQRSHTPRIIPHHIRIHEVSHPFDHGDMDAATHAGTDRAPPVTIRVLVRDLKVRCRFFDGYDWPRFVKKRAHTPTRHYKFIIDDTLDQQIGAAKSGDADVKHIEATKDETKSRLMGALLEGVNSNNSIGTFENSPLPEERAILIRDFAEERRLTRQMKTFLQISLLGVKVRIDTFAESTEHRLASCLDLKIRDLFIAETISNIKPVKLLGEWFNEIEHPRDSHDGLLMMKMVTWRPVHRISPENNEIVGDESHAVLHILPLRCYIDQRGLRFARAFCMSIEEKPPLKWAAHLKELPPPRFTWFKVKACKMKINYSPEKVDIDALRDGSVVELINISPINDMIIGLHSVEVDDKIGFGAVMSELVSSWIKDVCATQMYKFITNASAFQPISSVSGGAADMVVLPWNAIRNGEDVSRAVRNGLSSFGEILVFEALNTTARLTYFAAQQLQKVISASFPSRPQNMPRGVSETTSHAMESLARGLDHANYKIVVVPYKVFQEKGATSAAKSVLKGIPIAIMAPLASINEAMSYTLLGARNTLRPEVRKEDEASQSGLHYNF